MPNFLPWYWRADQRRYWRADQRHVTTTTSLVVVALAIAGVVMLVAWRGGLL